jgi:hypothetical protein
MLIQADLEPLPAQRQIQVYHGDTWQIPIQLNDTASQAHDLTGTTLAAGALDDTGTETALAATGGTDPTLGVVTVSDSPTAPLAPGVYRYDVQVTTLSNGTILTWVGGDLTVLKDVTPP